MKVSQRHVEVLALINDGDSDDVIRVVKKLSTTATPDGSRRLVAILQHDTTELAIERGLRTLDLTTRPSRESALKLYESVGFIRSHPNVLRFTPLTRVR